jgi:hypothetical protein
MKPKLTQGYGTYLHESVRRCVKNECLRGLSQLRQLGAPRNWSQYRRAFHSFYIDHIGGKRNFQLSNLA